MRIAICDDTLKDRERCAALLREVAGKYEIEIDILQFEKGDRLLFALEDVNEHIDLIYLDISMPGDDGMAIAQKIREKEYRCEIVFFTIKDYCWREAFFVKALHYIVKETFDREEFERIFLMAAEEVQRKTEESILFTCAGESRNIKISEILYFEVHDHIVTVCYKQDQKFEFYTPLSKIEKLLVNRPFMRCHKSYLISKKYVEYLVSNQITMTNGDIIPVSRTYKESVRKEMAEQ